MLKKNFILGVGVTNASKIEVLEFILKGLKTKGEKLFVVTPNPEIIVKAQHNKNFKGILNSAGLALPDGTGVIWAGKILGKKFKEKITGVDTLESLCKQASMWGFTIGLIGGGPEIAERTAECLLRKYPGLNIVLAAPEWPKTTDYRLQTTAVDSRPSTVDILFVAFGAPKQEIWISRNIENLPVKLAMGVGGSFDYIAGRVKRAPGWVRNIGLEWLFRLIEQPWRIKRQLALVEFAYLVIKEKFLDN